MFFFFLYNTHVKISVCKILMLILIIELSKANLMMAQSTASDSLQRSDRVEATASIEKAIDFCGCQSVDSVKKCSHCFYQSGPVLKSGFDMCFESKVVVKGSCWGFVDAVYKKAGVVKETVFSSKQGGPYANIDLIRPGDWIYHVNYSYNNVGHSAIFVCWKNKKLKQAITMSYVGMNRNVPGRLDLADLKGVYSIFRSKE